MKDLGSKEKRRSLFSRRKSTCAQAAMRSMIAAGSVSWASLLLMMEIETEGSFPEVAVIDMGLMVRGPSIFNNCQVRFFKHPALEWQVDITGDNCSDLSSLNLLNSLVSL